jgi:cupin 2 domain-containing protein
MKIANIFEDIPNELKEEIIQNILVTDNFRIERIVSECHATPPEYWYDQATNEFVLLISGSAGIMFEDRKIRKLRPGDYLIIEAHKKHRVEWTDLNIKTVWLTIHY